MLNASIDRSHAAPFTLPDELLEFYAQAYLDMPQLAWRGVSFEQFLAATPQVRQPGRLLPAQREVQQLSAMEQRVMRRALTRSVRVFSNGRLIEKLRHHRHPRGKRDFMPERSGS